MAHFVCDAPVLLNDQKVCGEDKVLYIKTCTCILEKNMQMEIHYQITASLQIILHSQQKYPELQDSYLVLLYPSSLNQLAHHHKSPPLYSSAKQALSLSEP